MASYFGNIYAAVHGPSLRRKQFKLERAQANARIASAERAIAFRKQETPREQAGMKQTMFARGIGKSTIADQEKGRLDNIQRWKMDAANSQLHLARRYKQYLKARQRYQRRSQYAEYLDAVVNTVVGVYSMGMMGGEGSQTQQGYSTQNDANYGGGGGDYNWGGQQGSNLI